MNLELPCVWVFAMIDLKWESLQTYQNIIIMQNCKFKNMCKVWTITGILNQELKKDKGTFIKLEPKNWIDHYI